MSKKKVIAPPKELFGKPWAPVTFALADGYALQALERGEATPEQQRQALQFIVNNVAGTYDLSYRSESSRDSDFAEGKRFVGLQIVRLIKTNMAIYAAPGEDQT